MKRMTEEKMMQVNGGKKYNYVCDCCHTLYKTAVGIIGHIAIVHFGFASYTRIKAR